MRNNIVILAFLQNMWFKDPDKARAVFARNPTRRNQLIGTYLFMGCLTGRRLEAVFGDICDEIIWEEISPDIGGKSSTAFPADPLHIKASIVLHNPNVILVFGKIAEDAIRNGDCIPELYQPITVIYGPHPAARSGAIEGLRQVKKSLDELISLG